MGLFVIPCFFIDTAETQETALSHTCIRYQSHVLVSNMRAQEKTCTTRLPKRLHDMQHLDPADFGVGKDTLRHVASKQMPASVETPEGLTWTSFGDGQGLRCSFDEQTKGQSGG